VQPPQVDRQHILDWVQRMGNQELGVRYDASMQINSTRYPWNIAYGKSNGQWLNGFEREFPELAQYPYTAFGVDESSFTHLVLLPVKSDFTGIGFWHSDPDEFGLRFYLDNEDTDDSLLIKPTIHPYETRQDFDFTYLSPEAFVQDIEHSATIVSPRQPFFINNVRAIHAVKTNIVGAFRLAFIVGSASKIKNMPQTLADLIVNSAQHYSDQSIEWTAPN
jgi:hypothetical protein